MVPESRTPYSAVDELFRNVPNATPKSVSSPEISEAMDIMSTNVVATVIGLTGTAIFVMTDDWLLATSIIRCKQRRSGIFLGRCSMPGVCSAAVPAVDDASISYSTKFFFWTKTWVQDKTKTWWVHYHRDPRGPRC